LIKEYQIIIIIIIEKMKNEEKILRDGYLLEEAAKETKVKETKIEKEKETILVNGLVFNKLNDDF
jgi:hypothetical protein